MTNVHFEIHRVVGSEVEELDEDELAARLAEDPELLPALVELEPLEGAIVIEGAAVVDDLASAVQRLCFEAVVALIAPGATYGYRYFTANQEAQLTATESSITLRGDDCPTREIPRQDLLPALFSCGHRYLELLTRLGEGGRTTSTVELAHLRGFAERARAALAEAGLIRSYGTD